MQDKKKVAILSVLALVAVVLAIVVGVKSSQGSKETVTDFKAVPPKGIGKAERD